MAPQRLQVYRGAEVTVSFDPARCIHHAHCVRAMSAVFDPAARPWIRPDAAPAETILQVVAGCPTGALQAELVHDGRTADALVPADPVEIQARRNGPLFVRGAVELVAEDGTVVGGGQRLALCRCGASARKPFCDNSHRTAGWRDAPSTA